jgi:hypothetical protein
LLYRESFAKTKNLKKFEGAECMRCHFFKHNILGGLKEHIRVIVKIQLSLGMSRKFLYFRENFSTKIAETLMMWNTGTWGMEYEIEC